MLVLLFCLAASVVGAPVSTASNSSNPVLPSNDPFYTPLSNVTSRPGQIYRSRQIQPAYTVSFAQGATSNVTMQGVAGYQLFFGTQDANSQPSFAVATVLVPQNSTSKEIVGFNFAINSPVLNCNPSYGLQNNASTLNSVLPIEEPKLQILLSLGYTVVVPDWEGLDMYWGSGPLAGHIALDSLRASISYLNLSSTPQIGLYGYSGASQPAGWAAELASSYAPELNIVGIAIGGTVGADVAADVRNLNTNSTNGGTFYAQMAMRSWSKQYSDVGSFIQQHATSAAQKNLTSISNMTECFLQSTAQVTSLEFQNTGTDLFQQPQLAGAISANVMATNASRTPKFPMYVQNGFSDETVPVAIADELVSRWCDNNITSLQYDRYEVGAYSHMTLTNGGFYAALSFLRSRFANETAKAGCQTTPIPCVALTFSNGTTAGNSSNPACASYSANVLGSGVAALFDEVLAPLAQQSM